jgi:hypothetical protein
MQTPEQKAIWSHAQTLALVGFFIIGAILMGSFVLVGHIDNKTVRTLIEWALYVPAFFAVFTINPMTHYFYTRLSRR